MTTLYDELKEKLSALPTKAVKTIAARSALHALPYVFELSDQGSYYIDKWLMLACLRATLVSGLAGARQTPETLALIPVMKSNLDAVSSEQTIEDLFKGARKAFFTIYIVLLST